MDRVMLVEHVAYVELESLTMHGSEKGYHLAFAADCGFAKSLSALTVAAPSLAGCAVLARAQSAA